MADIDSIDGMIEALQEQKKQHGNLPLELSCDSEGNHFSPPWSMFLEDGKLIIFPTD